MKNINIEKTYETELGFIITGRDNLEVLKEIPDNTIDQIYIDPPYLTNRTWEKNGWSFDDNFDSMWDYLFFLGERLVEAKRIMRTRTFQLVDDILYEYGKVCTYEPLRDKILDDYSGKGKRKLLLKGVEVGASIFVHIDYRTNSEIKTYLMDVLFGEGKSTIALDDVNTLMYSKIGKKLHTPIPVPEVEIEQGPSICMDFFGGSHSYAAACHKLGRRYISIEMNKTEQLFKDQISCI